MIDYTLKLCPFCGGEATIERKGTVRQSMIVACTNCGASMESGDVWGLTDDLAWNYRKREDTLEEAIKYAQTFCDRETFDVLDRMLEE